MTTLRTILVMCALGTENAELVLPCFADNLGRENRSKEERKECMLQTSLTQYLLSVSDCIVSQPFSPYNRGCQDSQGLP